MHILRIVLRILHTKRWAFIFCVFFACLLRISVRILHIFLRIILRISVRILRISLRFVLHFFAYFCAYSAYFFVYSAYICAYSAYFYAYSFSRLSKSFVLREFDVTVQCK